MRHNDKGHPGLDRRDLPAPVTVTGLQKNADGSVDLCFGPKAPAGKETNWVPTVADGGFEVLLRLYGPEKSFFDKKRVLPDLEKMN
jgi:hypothetical protein